MPSNTENKKEFGQCKSIPVNYFFAAHYDDAGQVIGGYRPIPGVILFTETMVFAKKGNTCSKPEIKLRPWFTNYNGVLNHLNNDFTEGTRWYALSDNGGKAQKAFFPSIEQISYFYAASGDKWVQIVSDGLLREVEKKRNDGLNTGNATIRLSQQTIPFAEIRKPKSNEELREELAIEQGSVSKKIINENLRKDNKEKIIIDNEHPEIIYRSWYEQQKNINQELHGFVIPQSRYIVFTFSHPMAEFWNLSFWLNDEEEKTQKLSISPDDDTNPIFYTAIYHAPVAELKKGLYTIQIDSNSRPFSSQWGTKFTTQQYYQLKENFRFGLKNIAGEFEIVNCDPITIEESLLKQFPLTYSHLINDSYLKMQGAPLASESPANNSGLKTVVSELQLRKQQADLVHNFFTADNGLKQSNLVAKGISSALRAAKVDEDLLRFVDTAFQINNFGYQIFQNIPDTIKEIKDKTGFAQTKIDEIINKLKQNNFLHWRYKNFPDPSITFENAWGGRLASNKYIPTEFMKKTLGAYAKVAKPIDGVLTVFNLINTGNHLYDASGNVKKAMHNSHGLFLDYHQQIHDWEDDTNGAQINASSVPDLPASSFKPNEYGQISFSIYFDTDKSQTKPETSQYKENKTVSQILALDEINKDHSALEVVDTQAISELVNFLNKHKELNLLLVGHTDPVGSNQYNMALSERRANAVQQLLIEKGIAAERLTIKSMGETRLVYTDGQADYEKCRRVEVTNLFSGHANYLPSREAMAFLEQSRDAGVLQELEVEKTQLAMAADAWNALRFTLAVLPSGVSQITALVITVTEMGLDVIKNVGAWADSVLLDKFFQTIIVQQKKLSAFQGASLANQRLLRAAIDQFQKNPSSLYLNTQHKVRAEALYGLIGLITRASISTSSQSEFAEKIKEYQIDAYIDNFLLNDGWRFPLEPEFPITMDEFWLFVVKTSAHHTGENYNWYGFDIHHKLVKLPKKDAWGMPDSLAMLYYHADDFYDRSQSIISKKALLKDIIIKQNLGESGKYGQHIFSLASNDVPKHQKADFQSCFPIHHLHSKEITKLAMDFNTDFSDIDDDYYEYTAIYARPPKAQWNGKEPDWQSLKQYQQTKADGILSAFDQIRILVVFKTRTGKNDTQKNALDINGVYPAAIQLHRRDTNNIDGPRYRTLAKRLDKGELLKEEQEYAHHVGYVVYPFFQFGQTTYSGTKPLATKTSLSLAEWMHWGSLDKERDSKGFEQAYDYWRMGGLDEMHYEFTANIGDQRDGHPIRIAGKDTDWFYDKEYKVSVQGRELVSKTKIRGIGRSAYYKYQYHWLPDARLLYAPFLMSAAKEAERPPLFTEDEDVKVLLRIGGENGSDYLCSHRGFYQLSAKDNNKQYGIRLRSPNLLTVNQFDWNTSVEFIFLVTADEIDSDGYQAQNYNWQSIPYSVQMKEFSGSDTNGPALSGKLSYLGILNNNRKSDKERFEIDNQKKTIPPELQPLVDILSKRDNCSHALSGFHEGGIFSDKRYVFAAYYKCRYESLTGQLINSLRPFSRHDSSFNSERVALDDNETTEDYYFRIGLSDFIAGGQNISSGLISIKNGDEFVGQDVEFRIRSPKDLLNAPWTDLSTDAEQKIEQAKALDKETLLTNWVNKSSDEKKKAVKFWIEEDTGTLKQIATRVFR